MFVVEQVHHMINAGLAFRLVSASASSRLHLVLCSSGVAAANSGSSQQRSDALWGQESGNVASMVKPSFGFSYRFFGRGNLCIASKMLA